MAGAGRRRACVFGIAVASFGSGGTPGLVSTSSISAGNLIGSIFQPPVDAAAGAAGSTGLSTALAWAVVSGERVAMESRLASEAVAAAELDDATLDESVVFAASVRLEDAVDCDDFLD